MQFVFQGLPLSWAPHGQIIGADELLLSKTVALYWANFARSGDPNVGGSTPLSTTWPRFPDPRTRPPNAAEYLRLDLPKPEARAGRALAQCALLDALAPMATPLVDPPPGEEADRIGWRAE
jgi:hypothetical protein